MADDSRKLFYSIGEVAAIFHVNESTLRFWEKEFQQQITPHKNAKGTRSYTEENIETLKVIYNLVRVQGLTLAGAKKKLKENKSSLIKENEIRTRLLFVQEELKSIQKGLTLPSDEPYLD